jgi:U2-associated protein SR140
LTGQQLARARDRERGRETNRLPDEAYDKFIDILKELTLEREAVKRAMGFALDNSEASVDIVQILVQHFKKSKEEGASAIMKVAWFYLTSDILHNSSAAMKNASLYRTTLQDYLPEIMDHLRQAQKRITGRMSANAMKEKILNVLTAWESWSLFPPLYLVGLNATFLRKQDAQTFNDESLESGSQDDEETLRKKCKQAGIMWDGSSKTLQMRLQWLKEFTAPKSTASSQTKKKAVRGEQEEDLDGEPMYENEQTEITAEGLDGKPIDDDDFDGEPMDDEDLDGAPLDEDEEDLDGAPLDEDEEDLNGAPLDEEEEPLDGAPLDDDEDLDGQPL